MTDELRVRVYHKDDPDSDPGQLLRDLDEFGRPFPEELALLERIDIDPEIVFGRPRINGTRLWDGFILGLLRHGQSREEIAESYGLTVEDVQAALYYAETVVAEKQQPPEWLRRGRRSVDSDPEGNGEGPG